VDRLEREKLKHDKFVEQVGHTIEVAAEHKSQVYKIGGAVLGVLVLGFGIYFYREHAAAQRQEALRDALRIQQAQVSQQGDSEFVVSYPDQATKDRETEKALREMAGKYSGSNEAAVARFYLGALYADQGKTAEAEKEWKEVASSGDKSYASQAKLSLAQLYSSDGRTADSEKLLRELIASPTFMVSKEQATITLARVLAPSKPDEARKLLEPLRGDKSSAVSRTALNALGELQR
jgi:predicted negative regulator of RcsB-dependent stress response